MKRLLVLLFMVFLSVATVSFGDEPTSTYGIATIDGIMGPGEWDNAVQIGFQANVPSADGGGTTPGTLYVMNDGINLYLAVKIARPSFGVTTQFFSEFDNNNNGIKEHGDDKLAMSVGNSSTAIFQDGYFYTCPGEPAGSGNCPAWDESESGGILPAGTRDGVVAAGNDGSVTFIELSHLLKGPDTLHDFSLKSSDKVGHRHILTLASLTLPPRGTQYDLAHTVLPGASTINGYSEYTIASPPVARVMQVGMDIKPGGSVNSINRKSEGKIPVAILSSADFNAPVRVNRELLTFGRTGVEASPKFCNSGSEDANNDGLPDLVCHFMTQLTGFELGDSAGILKGQTTDGIPIIARDSIRIVK